MTTTQTQSPQPAPTASAPRISLSGERLHFVSFRKPGPRPSPRMRLTSGLVGRR